MALYGTLWHFMAPYGTYLLYIKLFVEQECDFSILGRCVFAICVRDELHTLHRHTTICVYAICVRDDLHKFHRHTTVCLHAICVRDELHTFHRHMTM